MVHFNWTQLIPAVGHYHVHVATLMVAGLLVLSFGLWARVALGPIDEGYFPESKLSVKGFFEAITEFIVAISDLVLGKEGRKFVPLFATLFLLIFINNIFGLLPGWTPATDDLNTTLAFGLFMFIVYNYFGFKEHGIGYLKQFMGPLLPLVPLLLVVEVISHSVRPLILGLRLKWNLTADHILLGVSYSLVEFVLPVAVMFLGLFVSFMQAFVFTVLGMVYVSMAISHDH